MNYKSHEINTNNWFNIIILHWFRFLTEDQLQNVCGISNDTHRHCIINSIKSKFFIFKF